MTFVQIYYYQQVLSFLRMAIKLNIIERDFFMKITFLITNDSLSFVES